MPAYYSPENAENPVAPPAAAPAPPPPSTVPAPPAAGAPTTTAPAPAPGTGMIDPSQSTLSASFAPYVYNMLEMGAGAAAQPYQAYEDPRYAAPTALQQQAYTGIAGLTPPTQFDTATQMATQAGNAMGDMRYDPTQFNTGLGPIRSVQDYMSDYTSGVSDIAAREATRQADISRQAEQARMAQAGGYGGSRQAIMEAERQRNLGTQIGDIRTQGLQAAYDRANQQRIQEATLGMEAQRGSEQSRQYGANLGFQGLQGQLNAAQGLGALGTQQQQAGISALNTQLAAGGQQQADQQRNLDFAYQQYQESMQHPYRQASYMQSLLQGMPLEAPRYYPGDSGIGSLATGALTGAGVYNMFNPTPINAPAPPAPAPSTP